MNNYYTPSGPKIAIYGVIIVCAFLAMAWMVRNMVRQHDPGPVNSARAEERVKARKELAKASTEELTTAGWADQPRGIVRLPIATAMELTVQKYQNPDAARADLIERVKKASAPAPVAPEQPSEFE